MNRKISKTLKGLGLAGLVLSVGMMFTGCKCMSSCSSCGGKKHAEGKSSCSKSSCTGSSTNKPAMPMK